MSLVRFPDHIFFFAPCAGGGDVTLFSLRIAAIDLDQLGIAHVLAECFHDGLKINRKAIRRELYAIHKP